MSDTCLPGDTRQRIQDPIKDRKITQSELAEKVGFSNSALSRYLQGRTKTLGDGFIIRVTRYFDVSTDFLLGETEIPFIKPVIICIEFFIIIAVKLMCFKVFFRSIVAFNIHRIRISS